MTLLAETGEEELTQIENRVRAYTNPDKIFNYFASYQLVSKGGKFPLIYSTSLPQIRNKFKDIKRLHHHYVLYLVLQYIMQVQRCCAIIKNIYL